MFERKDKYEAQSREIQRIYNQTMAHLQGLYTPITPLLGDYDDGQLLAGEFDQQQQQLFPEGIKGSKSVICLELRALDSHNDLRTYFNDLLLNGFEDIKKAEKVKSTIQKITPWANLTKYNQKIKTEKAYLSNKKFVVYKEDEIKLQHYQHFIIQRREQYEELFTYVLEQIANISVIENKEKFLFMGSPLRDLSRQCRQRIAEKSFLLLQFWENEGKLREQKGITRWRIIFVPKDVNQIRIIPKINICIYFQDYTNNKRKQPLSESDCRKIVEKLRLAYVIESNSKHIENISNKYYNIAEFSLSNSFTIQGLSSHFVVPIKDEIHLKNAQTIFQEYDADCISRFIKQWKKRAESVKQRSITYLFIQPTYISLPKEWLTKDISLKAKCMDKTSESIDFKFDRQEGEQFIFVPRSRNKDETMKNFFWQYPKNQRNSPVEFIVNADMQKREQSSRKAVKLQLKNRVSISESQNEGLGFAYEISLHPNKEVLEDKQSQGLIHTLHFEALMASRWQKEGDIQLDVQRNRSINLLSKMGKVPNMYSRFYQIDFNPNIYPKISQIFKGRVGPIDKKAFQLSYLQYTQFFEKQQNLSQNTCESLKRRNQNKKDQSGFKMEDRFERYKETLMPTYEKVRNNWSKIWEEQPRAGSLSSSDNSRAREKVNISKISQSKHMKNMKEDLLSCSSPNKELIEWVLKRYIIYCEYANKNLPKGEQKMSYSQGLVKIADMLEEVYDRSSNVRSSRLIDNTELFYMFTAFVTRFYPYHTQPEALQNDLYCLRGLAQKYLPQFNRQLNRKGIGLENFCSNYLLNFFTTLPMQLCYRIWDFLMANANKKQSSESKSIEARLIVVYTLMIFQEKSYLLPIFPINTFIQSVHINSYKLKPPAASIFHNAKNMKTFTLKRAARREKVKELAQEKIIRRFIFGKNIKEIDLLDEEQFDRKFQKKKTSTYQTPATQIAKQKLHSKLMSMNEISYPLPKPNHQGYRIMRLCVFVSGVFILRKLDFHSNKYKLRLNISGGSQIIEIELTSKNVFVNQFFPISIPADKPAPQTLQFWLDEKQKTILKQSISLENYHKDVIYRESVSLCEEHLDEKYNLGTSVITFSLLLVSENQGKRGDELLEEIDTREDEIFEKMMDYDISPDNNAVVKQMRRLDKSMRKIMDPLDELEAEKHENLRLTTSFEQSQPEWIKNSKVSVEELKAIFNYIFTEEKEKQFKLKYPFFYEDYAQGDHQFDLGKFLLQLILMNPMSQNKKMSLMYCLAIHYQNISHKPGMQKMTVQTLNSIIRQIFINYGMVNACPFSQSHYGQIISGCFYLKGDKVEEQKKDITQTLQDWAYLCQYKSKFGTMALGTAEELNVLRAMLPVKVLQKIEENKLCRFEIIYRKGSEQFIWSATVNTSDFTVAHRGVKFQNYYPQYKDFSQSLNSISETLLNCENIIPLQDSTSLTYEQFCRIFRKNALLSYLLNTDLDAGKSTLSPSEPTVSFELSDINKRINRDYGMMQEVNKKNNTYSDFAVFRYQNCLAEWRRCLVKKDEGKTLVLVTFEGLPGFYLVPRYEVISMDENLEADTGDGSESVSSSRLK